MYTEKKFQENYCATTFILLGNGAGSFVPRLETADLSILRTIQTSNFPRVPSPEPSDGQGILTLEDLKNREDHLREISRLLGKIVILLFGYFVKICASS